MLEAVCRGLVWDLGEIWMLHPVGDSLALRHMWTSPDLKQVLSKDWRSAFPVGEGIPGEVWTTNEPFWLPDVTHDEAFLRADAAREANLRAAFGYPIRYGDDVLGVIEFFSREVREPNDMILAATDSLGRQFGSFIKRTEFAEALLANERRLRIALRAASLGDWEWDITTNEVIWSRNLEVIHGLAPGTFDGTFDAYISDVHPRDRDRVIEEIQASVERGTHEIEYRIVRPDQSVRWLAASGEVLRDSQGNPVKMVGVCSDVTERKMREQRQRFLSEASVVLVQTLDPDETLNQLANLIVGSLADWCAIDLYDGRTITRAVLAHKDPAKEELATRLRPYIYDPERIRDTLALLERGESLLYEHLGRPELESAAIDSEHLALMEQLGFHSTMIVPMRVRRRLIGGITFICGEESISNFTAEDLVLAEDLARRAAFALDNAQLYRQAEETKEELRLANQFKDEFVGFVSHELRTPLTTIYGGARILTTRGEQLESETREQVVADIETEAERMHRIVEDLLVLARPERPQSELPLEPLRVADIVERIRTRFDRRHPGRLNVHLEDNLPIVLAEGAGIEQVLRNLTSNAQKYSDAGIELTAERRGSEVVVSVRDRGPGVPEEEIAQLFESFYRSETHATKHGIGLGLTVCKRLVEAQGGRIWAEARDGGGLTVAFSLSALEGTSD